MSKALVNKGNVIMLDKERRISIDMNALVELEEKYGNIDKAFSAISANPKMKDIRYILYLSLMHEDSELTETKVGKLVSMNNLALVMDALGNALTDSLPEAKEEDSKN